MRSFPWFLAAACCPVFLMLTGGCASIAHPGPDKVTFRSEPAGAAVEVDGAPIGVAPVTTDVGRKARYVTFRIPNYEEEKVPIERKLNPWLFGNVLFGGVIGIVVDVVTGNHMEAEKEMRVTLHHSAGGQATTGWAPRGNAGGRGGTVANVD